MIQCSKCKVVVSDLRRHLDRDRCTEQHIRGHLRGKK